jgi:hypothetical protein
MAENMHNKLKDENVDNNLIGQGYEHKAYLQRQHSTECMAFYD